jgi:hypothetical protein
VAQVSIDDVAHKRKRLDQYLSGATGQTIVLVPSVFDACYLQLGQLRQKPPGETARHLKLCAVPACGRLFWAPRAKNTRCEEHFSRGAVWAANKRNRLRPSSTIP